MNDRGRRGDLIVDVTVVVPTRLDRTQRELLERLADDREERDAGAIEGGRRRPAGGFFSRLKDAFD